MFGEGAVTVFLELCYLVDEGDGEVVVQRCAGFKEGLVRFSGIQVQWNGRCGRTVRLICLRR